MDDIFKRIIVMLIGSVILVGLLCGTYFYNDVRNHRNITKTDHLSGQRIGLMCGWESDYFLTPREDITLKRYDTTADLFMALNYNQVDALAIDDSLYSICKSCISNIDIVGEPLDQFYYTYYTCFDDDFNDKLNTFIKEFKETDEYQDFINKCYDLEWVNSDDYTPETGAGDEINVGYVAEYYPSIFVDGKGNIRGPEREFAVLFANHYNYKINWKPISSATFAMDIAYGKLNMAACSANELYRSELDNPDTAFARMSDGFMPSNINVVVATGPISIDNSFIFEYNE